MILQEVREARTDYSQGSSRRIALQKRPVVSVRLSARRSVSQLAVPVLTQCVSSFLGCSLSVLRGLVAGRPLLAQLRS